ncbi:MAG TPA: SPFH domain-containing protein [Vicinamibacterales bacterium]|nr:SPFH domain-containing protein [Vicinamibacterales bacterium]
MLLFKYLLMLGSAGLFSAAAEVLVADVVKAARESQSLMLRWRLATRLALLAWLPLLPALSIVVVPSGMAGVRISQLSGTLAGTLYPGTHFVLPLVHRVELFNIRDQVFATNPLEIAKDQTPVLKVYSREGLPVGLGVSVRYQLDPQRLPYVENNLPQPIETEIMPPVVANAFRQTVSGYLVRDVFSAKREEVRRMAAEAITKRLASDGIVVKEVMLRDVALPPEYAKGLEGLLIKAQENDRLSIEVEVKQKMVRTAELEAEADKARHVKQAEGRAQVTVLEAKAQADAMQHTLPLKEKQIQQSRLEAEARKEATVKNAEAAAAAKVIDSKAELEKRNLLSQADAQRVRIMAVADAERMKSEAQVLKESPLLIQKIVAERLSDKVQIMMVPMDGKFFFANDVLKTTPFGAFGVPHPNQH